MGWLNASTRLTYLGRPACMATALPAGTAANRGGSPASAPPMALAKFLSSLLYVPSMLMVVSGNGPRTRTALRCAARPGSWASARCSCTSPSGSASWPKAVGRGSGGVRAMRPWWWDAMACSCRCRTPALRGTSGSAGPTHAALARPTTLAHSALTGRCRFCLGPGWQNRGQAGPA